MMDEDARELLAELDNEWNTLKLGSPIPGLYVQSGAETVRVKGTSVIKGSKVITEYTVVISDGGKVVGTYEVKATESKQAVEHCYGNER